MSRIHDAIKKAELERASNATHGTDDSTVRVDTKPIPSSSVPSLPSLGQPGRSEGISGPFSFNEIWANCSRPQWKPNANLLVFGNNNPFNPGTEQFRTLRSRLYRMRENQPLKTILISSAIPAEGKTFVATNLALALVRQHGCRVLLVDADLRSPRIHTLLGAPPTPGFADYLQGGANELKVIQRGHEEGLCFLPAGNHVTHPSELISSLKLKQFLDRAKPAFDWIIIDSPPALPVADASVLGGLCDGVLFVVRANSTPTETAQKACRELHDAHILGVILNTVDNATEYGTYYNYGATAEKPLSPGKA